MVQRDAEFVVLESGALQVVVVEIPGHIARTIHIPTSAPRREDSALKLVFVVESISRARALAAEMGSIIDSETREWMFQGLKVCDGHDPEANVIQVREHAL